MRKYFTFQISKAVTVKNLVTIEKLDLQENFVYPKETHNFYEFVYVDYGKIICQRQTEKIELCQADFYLIPPNCEHEYLVEKNSASVFILCFNAKADILQLLDQKINLDKQEKSVIANIIKEAQGTFVFPFNEKLKLVEKPSFGAGQLIESYVEELLIKLIRKKIEGQTDVKIVMSSQELENSLVSDIIKALNENVYCNLTLEQISKKTFYSKTYLNNIFKKNTSKTIIQYFLILKIKEAQKLLRKGFSVSNVSDTLNFDNPNYFSKVFKKHVGLTPSQYKKTIL